jgi:hypothetical protein
MATPPSPPTTTGDSLTPTAEPRDALSLATDGSGADVDMVLEVEKELKTKVRETLSSIKFKSPSAVRQQTIFATSNKASFDAQAQTPMQSTTQGSTDAQMCDCARAF